MSVFTSVVQDMNSDSLQVLSGALQETRRAGEHLITTDALQLLQWELHGAAIAVLQQVTSSTDGDIVSTRAIHGTNNTSITEKGVLQMLFDQRLFRDVIGAGKPLGGTAAAASAAGIGDAAGQLATRKRLVASVEQQLQVSHEAMGS